MKFSEKKLASLLERATRGRLRALVFGDIIVERDIFGQATRLAPEADTPVVLAQNERATAGGAGNVAANLAGLGARTTLVGYVGDNAPGAAALSYLRAAGAGAGAGVPHGRALGQCCGGTISSPREEWLRGHDRIG